MSQVRIGTVDVTNGSQVVSGSGTNWLSSVSANDLFIIQGESVIYRIASVASDTQLSLSSNYVGVTATALPYVVHIDFTTSGIPLMQDGDIETVSIYNLAVVSLEQGLSFGTYYLGAFAVAPTETGTGGAITEGMMYFDTVTDLLNVYDGSAWYDGAVSAIAAAQSAAEAAADAVQTGLDRVQTGLDRVQTTSDRIQTISDAAQTASDRVQTGLDRTQTNLDVTQTTLDAAATAADRVQTTADAVQTNLDVTQTILDAAQTAADRVQTGLDVTQTGLDRVQTTADRIQTISDAAATAADRVQTGLDATQTGIDAAQTVSDAILTAADRVQTGLDAVDTAADAVQTGLDRTQTTADASQTASDRVQTGLDATQTAADRAQTVADAAQTAADRVQTSADRVQTISDAASTAADRVYVDGVEANVAAIEVSINNTFDTFDDRFLGTFTTDPTHDNDGNAISVGAVYYNSVELATKFYNGSTWDDPSQSASTSATNALNSENAAALSETNAAASEVAAASSEANALASKNAASTSETNAASSETNAATSETNALASKNSAEAAEVNALASESAAATSESNASASETAAGISETNSLASENAAALSETNAATSESNAATSESNAAASESAASTSEGNAATSASAASGSETSASNSAIAAAASYDSFDDRYLGPKASDPTLDNDGNALLSGAMYWSTSEDVMKVYTGSLWKLVSTVVEGVYQVTEFTNIATQTTLTITYDVGLAQVLYNGVQLNFSDFTATNGTTIVLASPVALADDVVTVILWGAVTSSSLVGTAAALDTGTAAGELPTNADLATGAFTTVGTAATANVQTSATDTTAGSLMAVGAFGLGTKDIGSVSFADFDIQQGSGFTYRANSSPNAPVTGGPSLYALELPGSSIGTYGHLCVSTIGDAYVRGNAGLAWQEVITANAAGNVGIGAVPEAWKSTWRALDVGVAASLYSQDGNIAGLASNVYFNGTNWIHKNTGAVAFYQQNEGSHIFYNAASGTAGDSFTPAERMRLDQAGNLLVGKTAAGTAEGVQIEPAGAISLVRGGSTTLYLNRLTSDGDLISFRKDSTTVGSIRVGGGNITIVSPTTGVLNAEGADRYKWDGSQFYPGVNNACNLGHPSYRWTDVYTINAVNSTSDRTQKQDILEITTAETAVAKACKGLLRSFRWKDAVAEKGDDARIHFGIMAQDLQDAFTAEGLDAGRYGMFMSNTWWETETEVAAVEAADEVTDEDGNVTTEVVEAKDAYTRTDTFDTLAEAPAGATERTRLGVRYTELLAFIIAAI